MNWQQKLLYSLLCFGTILVIKSSLLASSLFHSESYLYHFPMAFLSSEAYKIANIFKDIWSLSALWWVVHFLLPLGACLLFVWVACIFRLGKVLVPVGLSILFVAYPLYDLSSLFPFFLCVGLCLGGVLGGYFYGSTSKKYYLVLSVGCAGLLVGVLYSLSLDTAQTTVLTHSLSQEKLVFLELVKSAPYFSLRLDIVALLCLALASSYLAYRNKKALFFLSLTAMSILGIWHIHSANITTLASISHTKNHSQAVSFLKEQNTSTVFGWTHNADILQYSTQTAHPSNSIDKYLLAKIFTSTPSVATSYLQTFYANSTSPAEVFKTYDSSRAQTSSKVQASFFLDDSLLWYLPEIFTYASQDLKGATTPPNIVVDRVYSIENTNNFYAKANAKKHYKTKDFFLDLSSGTVFRQDKSYFFVHSAFVSGSEKLQQISYENNENATNIAIVYKEKYLILLPRIYLPSLIVQSLFLSKVDEKFFRLAYRNGSVVILESR